MTYTGEVAATGERDWLMVSRPPETRARGLRLVRDRSRYLPAMELIASEPIDAQLLAQWASLPPFPYVLECLGGERDPLLAFAALDWTAERIPFSSSRISIAATAAVALTRVFSMISVCVPADRWWLFTRPFVALDLEDRPRVGFATPPARGATCDVRAFVDAVGRLVLDLVDLQEADAEAPLARVIRRATDPDPQRRYDTLESLRAAFVEAGGLRARGNPVDGLCWDAVERGIGFLHLEDWPRARHAFARALSLHAGHVIASRGAAMAGARDPSGVSVTVDPRAGFGAAHELTIEVPVQSWAELAPIAARFEAEHDPRAALALYRSVQASPGNGVHLGIARTSLALGDTGYAIDFARRARRDDPSSTEAFRLEATALLRRRQYGDALACIDAWAAVAPDEGARHYARGKALLGLSRLPEAREAFDRATVLAPTMIEAMLLRREVDRHMANQRATAGAQAQAPFEIPPALAGFRDAMVSGHVVEAIALLRTERYAADSMAQIVLAQLLFYDGAHAEALAIFLRYLDGEHKRAALVGAAESCLALGQSEAALAAANRLDPRKDIRAIELRARAFAQLGRDAEAEAELQRYVAANRGDLRVRSALGER